MIFVMLCEPALLGQHANRYGGGSTCHAQGSDSTTRTNGYAEKRPTLPGRAPRTTTNTATPHTMLKGQGLRPAVTPMGLRDAYCRPGNICNQRLWWQRISCRRIRDDDRHGRIWWQRDPLPGSRHGWND